MNSINPCTGCHMGITKVMTLTSARTGRHDIKCLHCSQALPEWYDAADEAREEWNKHNPIAEHLPGSDQHYRAESLAILARAVKREEDIITEHSRKGRGWDSASRVIRAETCIERYRGIINEMEAI